MILNSALAPAYGGLGDHLLLVPVEKIRTFLIVSSIVLYYLVRGQCFWEFKVATNQFLP